ncbi:emp24/gp25L/p24 family/GOLD family protein [Actinidia rufa]|uniref:Emp24/gp25L/p24 family/GOLD family protein n=1 Tax=Actinidia rufa TaxID=165716 RepID=A0A7J0EQK4_9ERIC|nr:emp24/gp25L/p24 family/GOLD family protein [Actinidia rufa]
MRRATLVRCSRHAPHQSGYALPTSRRRVHTSCASNNSAFKQLFLVTLMKKSGKQVFVMNFVGFCWVTSTYGNSHHHVENVESGQFGFQAVEAGDYMACFFSAEPRSQATITVEFEWKTGVASKDWTTVAKKGSVDVSVCARV